ncbi:MAG: FecR domain-containing protein [Pseudomonadota bacterium]
MVGDAIPLGAVVETGPNGRFGAMLDDGTTVALGENGRIEFTRYRFEPGPGLYDFLLRVLQGRVIYGSGRIGEAAPERVRIEAPELSIGTRGTRFAVIAP